MNHNEIIRLLRHWTLVSNSLYWWSFAKCRRKSYFRNVTYEQSSQWCDGISHSNLIWFCKFDLFLYERPHLQWYQFFFLTKICLVGLATGERCASDCKNINQLSERKRMVRNVYYWFSFNYNGRDIDGENN